MRFLSFILSFYILILGIIPCADAAVDVSSTQEAQVSIQTPLQDHGASHSEDACSPFCSCSCCHINIDQPVPPTEISPNLFSKSIDNNTSLFYRDLFSSIWQPPKI